VAAGAALLLIPRRVLEQPTAARRIFFETDLAMLFDRRFAIERGVYRRHRAFGVLVLAGALALMALIWFMSRGARTTALGAVVGAQGIRTLALLGITLGIGLLLFGICLLVRPSVLKGVEAAANRWIDPLPAHNPHMVVSRVVIRAPRLLGLLLLAAGLACWRPF
jgi:hypothetical protein